MSYQQDAFRNASAKLLEFLRFTQELNNLPQLFFGFIYACDILECDFLLLHGKQPRPALSKTQSLVAAGLHLADHDEPQHAQQDDRRELHQPHGPVCALTVFHVDSHIFVIIEHLPQFGIIGVDAEVVLLAVFELAMSFITNNRNLRNLIARGSARIVDIVYLS